MRSSEAIFFALLHARAAVAATPPKDPKSSRHHRVFLSPRILYLGQYADRIAIVAHLLTKRAWSKLRGTYETEPDGKLPSTNKVCFAWLLTANSSLDFLILVRAPKRTNNIFEKHTQGRTAKTHVRDTKARHYESGTETNRLA